MPRLKVCLIVFVILFTASCDILRDLIGQDNDKCPEAGMEAVIVSIATDTSTTYNGFAKVESSFPDCPKYNIQNITFSNVSETARPSWLLRSTLDVKAFPSNDRKETLHLERVAGSGAILVSWGGYVKNPDGSTKLNEWGSPVYRVDTIPGSQRVYDATNFPRY
jgi:hypothetical protein